ncbi:uncharacterized protein LACBIDRAFT_302064 [Laccaria bicolor S238N-H82]|uniref:Predicted protein n=1 Tax=Laccaria bicolor (strain S238N-H82 / ATCC MYA-4686) TaxID=486041 RepID=B0E3Y1_LACBS|nr:uncharacterized protein LACBIDRAFT_302064 [Laccaria bicolor S238N-H82]EDQ98453.1 predicted protein [Laccaria bicolor S238N-H82]|eukprot:XP_001890899.1 predicted protein [Laccaria bicolor S238N-H82]
MLEYIKGKSTHHGHSRIIKLPSPLGFREHASSQHGPFPSRLVQGDCPLRSV